MEPWVVRGGPRTQKPNGPGPQLEAVVGWWWNTGSAARSLMC